MYEDPRRRQSVCTGHFHSSISIFKWLTLQHTFCCLCVYVAHKSKLKQCIKTLNSSPKFEISCCSHILLLRLISRCVAHLCPLPTPYESQLWQVSHCTFHTFLHRSNFSEDLGKYRLRNFAEVAEDTALPVCVPHPSSLTCLIPMNS